MKRFIIGTLLCLADAHTICARFWNDVAESILTGKPVWLIVAQRERGND